MGLYNNFPYTDFHELNLDWIIKTVKDISEQWNSFNSHVDADAYNSVDPEVSVTGDLQNGLTFNFGLPRGAQGVQGPPGNDGTNGVGIASATVDASGNFSITLTDTTVINLGNIKGPAGQGLVILGEYATLAALQADHPTGSAGDAWLVGTGGSYTLYIWDTNLLDWKDAGTIASPSPYVSTPAMDGIGSAGSSNDYAKGDHVHPSDTSKQDVLTTGTLTVDGNAIGGSGAMNLLSSGNVKTVASQSLIGTGNVSLDDIGAQARLTTGANTVSVNGVAVPITSNIDLLTTTALSTINSQSIQTGADVSLATLGAQPTLVSGTNIKTINSASILTSGNIFVPTIYSGSGDPAAGTGVDGDLYIKTA